jgi:hypothetical protein
MAQMEAALEVHGKYKRALDLDESISAISAGPIYEFVILDGRSKVEAPFGRHTVASSAAT